MVPSYQMIALFCFATEVSDKMHYHTKEGQMENSASLVDIRQVVATSNTVSLASKTTEPDQ